MTSSLRSLKGVRRARINQCSSARAIRSGHCKACARGGGQWAVGGRRAVGSGLWAVVSSAQVLSTASAEGAYRPPPTAYRLPTLAHRRDDIRRHGGLPRLRLPREQAEPRRIVAERQEPAFVNVRVCGEL